MLGLEAATQVKKRAYAAIGELDGIISELRGQITAEELEQMKTPVGLSIGTIITKILEPVFRQYPEIDDDR